MSLPCFSAWAGVIKGKVVDDLKEPLEFVNVAVYQQGSTAPYKGTVSDLDGKFEIDGVKDGTYVVKLTFMGYTEQQRKAVVGAATGHTANLRTITLSEDRAVLQEVSVSTQKAAMRLDIDKKVFDVSQNISTAGLSASEALENIPSVEVDQEGNISLRGSESVTVWINGKAQGLTSDNRGDILQQLPAESIERIEVITNPSSKYSPEGSAGIINIILKRDRKAGYYGGVQLNMGVAKDQDPHGRLAANINYSSGVLEAYANVGVGRRIRSNHGFTDRDMIDASGNHYAYLNNTTEGGGKGTNLFGRAGLTWHFTEHDEVSAGYMGMFGLGKGNRDSRLSYIQSYYDGYASTGLLGSNMDGVPAEYISVRDNFTKDRPQMNHFEVSYKHEWKTNHTLDVIFSGGKWMGDNETGHQQAYDSLHYLGTVPMTAAAIAALPGAVSTEEWQESHINNRDWEVQVDYQQPLGESGKIEAGYKGTWSHENSPQETWSSLAKVAGSEIPALYNRFVYDQNIHAAYFNYQNRWNKLGYQVGLRGEYWTVDTQSKNYNEDKDASIAGLDVVPDYSKSFFELFPTVFLSYELPAHQELQLNYTRRLQRPWGGQLNSFKRIDDPTNISFGNPQLTPTYTNSYELNYLKNWDEHTLSVSSYFRPSDDVMQRISYVRDGIRYQTNENLTQEISSGLEVISKNKLFRILDLTTTVNAFYYKLEGGDFVINQSDRVHVASDEDFSWNASMMGQFTLPWQLAFQATGRYNAARIIAQGKREANFSLDMGLRRAFFDKRLTVNFNVRNALDSRKFRARTHSTNYSQLSEGVWGTRRFGVQISYSFGNMAGKPRRSGEHGGGDGMDNGSDMDNSGYGMGGE